MIKLEGGQPYIFTLETQKSVEIIFYGTKAGEDNVTELDISVDGSRNLYTDINAALGAPFIKIERVN